MVINIEAAGTAAAGVSQACGTHSHRLAAALVAPRPGSSRRATRDIVKENRSIYYFTRPGFLRLWRESESTFFGGRLRCP